jgi:hypothetical protein
MEPLTQTREDMFVDIDEYAGPPITEEMIAHAEVRLGVRLPPAYLALLRLQNGGVLRRCLFRPAGDEGREFSLLILFGIGGNTGIDVPMSRYRPGLLNEGDTLSVNESLQKNWRYPAESVVLCHLGHAGILLDYRTCGPEGEPSVIYADAETELYPQIEISPVAPNFAALLAGLTDVRVDGTRVWETLDR